MAATIEVEVWIAVNECGDVAIAGEQSEVVERFEENIGNVSEQEAIRYVKMIVTVPLPTVPVLRGVVPVEGEAGLTLQVA